MLAAAEHFEGDCVAGGAHSEVGLLKICVGEQPNTLRATVSLGVPTQAWDFEDECWLEPNNLRASVSLGVPTHRWGFED